MENIKIHQLEILIRFLESKVAHMQFDNRNIENEEVKKRIAKWNNKILYLEDELEKTIDTEFDEAVKGH